MSHIATIKTKMRELALLKLAIKRLEWEFLEGQTTHKWYGRWVGDSPMPEGVKIEDLGHCTHAIRVPGATYEIGLVQTAQGWVPRWDFWRCGGLSKNTGAKLAQAYNVEEKLAQCRKAGYQVREVLADNGDVLLEAVKWGG